MKIKFEELKKIPLKIATELKYIKELEEKNKIRLMEYREHENEIKDLYEYLERLIEIWNCNEEGLPEDFPF